MKKFAFLAALVPVFLLGGCNLFRGLSDKPAPEEVVLQEEVKTGTQMVDSLKTAREEKYDALELANYFRIVNADVAFIDDNAGDLYAGIVRGRYYVVVGAFEVEDNFNNMVRTVLDAGYLPTGVTLRNGMRSVAVSPVESRKEAEYAFISVRKESFCPDDAFVMYVKK